MMLGLALLYAAQAAASAGGGLSVAIYPSDYPVIARRNGWEGIVTAELTFDRQGYVESCRVLKPSAYPVLNDATCMVLAERARFHPQGGKRLRGGMVVQAPPVQWRLNP